MSSGLKIGLVCVEDGLMSIGVRKMAAVVRQQQPETVVHYVPFTNNRSLSVILAGTYGESAGAPDECLVEMAEHLAQFDLLGFSSMTGYATLTAEIIQAVREINPDVYVVWGGIHPIIVPEDAITHADAICTGEGELAFEEFFEAYKNGRDFTETRNFWFRTGDKIIRNGFRPLMTQEEMAALPTLLYGENEVIFEPGKGFVELDHARYIDYNGLGYNTVWSIGCPFKCTYCGNTKFIDNDAKYRSIRHPGVPYIMDELEQAVKMHPHISSISFHDDSFLALPKRVLREFAEQYKERVGLPFCILGVIPNYVNEEKLQILLDAGLNRARMGIQNGSERILKFYERPTPPEKINKAAAVFRKYRRYMIPPAYDIILDNPIENREDVLANLEFLHKLPRPFTLNIYSLRTIPNTRLVEQFEELKISLDEISANYTHNAPTLANCLVYLIATLRVPAWLFRWLSKRAEPLMAPQPHYPKLVLFCRLLFFVRRAISHLRFMDFSVLTGKAGYLLWKSGFIGFWTRWFVPRYRLPSQEASGDAPAAGSARDMPDEQVGLG
jgi:anaerobic magnesium-protoporphyrin IX monomethyl ester cyclase